MEKFRSYGASIVAVLLVAISSCNTATEKSNSGYTNTLSFSPGEESKISEALLSLKDSSVVELKAGNYKFDNLSIAQLKHIMLKGEGPDKTILDFSSQTQGGEGIRVTDVTGFNIEDIKLQNAKGDLIKVTKSRDVVFRNVHAVWDKSDSSSGGYALYPVMCKMYYWKIVMYRVHQMPVFMLAKPTVRLFVIAKASGMLPVARSKTRPMLKCMAMNSGEIVRDFLCLICLLYQSVAGM